MKIGATDPLVFSPAVLTNSFEVSLFFFHVFSELVRLSQFSFVFHTKSLEPALKQLPGGNTKAVQLVKPTQELVKTAVVNCAKERGCGGGPPMWSSSDEVSRVFRLGT